ncbi:MAG: tetratricopeptide repeat protein [Planctomycetales bacterium]
MTEEQPPTADSDNPWIIEATDESFDREVLERAGTTVVVDFWADWCQPCQMLKPILESLANEFAGRFVLVKANTEKFPELGARFGVQSLPTVVVFRDGEAIDGFQGVQPEPALREWLTQLLPSEVQLLAAEAKAQMKDDPAAAEEKLRRVLETEPDAAEVKIDLARLLFAQDRIEECRELAKDLEVCGLLDSEAEDVHAGLQLKSAAQDAGDLETCRQESEAAPEDFPLRLRLAQALAGAGEYEAALEICLQLVQQDKKGTGQPAKDAMVQMFHILGSTSELAISYRRKLSSALY